MSYARALQTLGTIFHTIVSQESKRGDSSAVSVLTSGQRNVEHQESFGDAYIQACLCMRDQELEMYHEKIHRIIGSSQQRLILEDVLDEYSPQGDICRQVEGISHRFPDMVTYGMFVALRPYWLALVGPHRTGNETFHSSVFDLPKNAADDK